MALFNENKYAPSHIFFNNPSAINFKFFTIKYGTFLPSDVFERNFDLRTVFFFFYVQREHNNIDENKFLDADKVDNGNGHE